VSVASHGSGSPRAILRAGIATITGADERLRQKIVASEYWPFNFAEVFLSIFPPRFLLTPFAPVDKNQIQVLIWTRQLYQ
jgi:hypothetical protein